MIKIVIIATMVFLSYMNYAIASNSKAVVCKTPEQISKVRYELIKTGSLRGSSQVEEYFINETCSIIESREIWENGIVDVDVYKEYSQYKIFKAFFSSYNSSVYFFMY